VSTTARSIVSRRQAGASAVEFALVSTVFFMLLFGAIEVGKVLFYWNAAVEGTRSAARTAVVCDLNAAAVKSRITTMLPLITASSINVVYEPTGCSASASPICTQVTISVKAGTEVPVAIPFASLTKISMPGFSTTLTTESLQSSVGLVANPACS
jgi:Flp pilus assembly protein TadG